MRSFILSSIIFLSLASTLAAAELTCLKGTIKKLYEMKEITEPSEFCTNAEGNVLISKTCEKLDCLKDLPLAEVKFNTAGVGTPGFALCRKLGGGPEIVEFQVKEKWYKLDRCLLKQRSHYVDAGTLFQWNKERATRASRGSSR